MVVYDTYAWVEYFRGTEKGAMVRKLLETEEGLTPAIVLAELARKYVREGFSEREVRRRLEFVEAKTARVDVDADLALTAAELYLRLLEVARERSLRSPSLADAIVYACALVRGDMLVTGDRLFRDLDSVVYIGD